MKIGYWECVAYHESLHVDPTGVRGHVELLGRGPVVLRGDHHAVASQPDNGGEPGDGEEGGAHLSELNVSGCRDWTRG